MRARILSSTVSCLIGLALARDLPVAHADPLRAGQPSFSFGAYVPPRHVMSAGGSQVMRCWVVLAERYGPNVQGTVSFDVPDGIKIAASDQHHSVVGLVARHWSVPIAADSGLHVVRVHLVVIDPGWGRDEGEFDVRMTADAKGITVSDIVERRLEWVKKGQRYRYGWDDMVPIEASGQVVQSEIEKAAVIHSEPAVCGDCGLAGPDTVELRLIVDQTGAVKAALPQRTSFLAQALGHRDTESPIDVAAKAALARWTFKPATTHGKAIADFLLVSVEVRPQ